MTPTDELRAKLDEHGVEWNAIDGDGMCFTEWRTHGGAFVYTARESFRSYGDNDLRVETCGIPKSCLIATPEQAIAATLGGDNSDTVKHLMKLQGGHYTWPMLYEAVTGDPFDYDCPPSKSEEVFIEKLISIVGGRELADE